MKLTYIFCLLLFISFTATAQEDTTAKRRVSLIDLLPENHHIDMQNSPYYNFGKGVGITSPDSLFQLNIRFRMQNRLELLHNESNENLINAAIRRLRLRFDGYVGSTKFPYVIQLSFSPEDVGELEEGRNLNVIRDAIVYYQPNEKWSFGFGQTKLPGNRQRVNSSGALQLTDRSINNAFFNIDRDFGFQGHYLSKMSGDFQYNLRGAVTTGEGRNWTNSKNGGLAYTGRTELFPLGRFTNGGEFFEGDIARESTPKIMVGATYHYNDDATRNRGQQGSELYESRNLQSFFFDAMGKYNGWALMYAFMNRQTNDPVTRSASDASLYKYVNVGNGQDIQGSYIFKKDWELIGRYSTQTPDKNIFEFQPKQKQYTLGVTKYIWEHAFKIQTEFSFNQFQHFNNTNTQSWYWRFQIEMGI